MLKRLVNTTVQQNVLIEGLKVQIDTLKDEMKEKIADLKMQHFLLFNSTISEFRTYFEQIKLSKTEKNESISEELQDELGDIRSTVNGVKKILLELQRNPRRPGKNIMCINEVSFYI